MKIVDANILIYAVNRGAPDHAAAAAWLEAALNGSETIAFGWIGLLAFVRIVTRPGLFTRPLTVKEAFDTVDGWLAAPNAVIAHPGDRHAAQLRELLSATGTAGNLTSDAHLAALAIELDAEMISFDGDFARFPGLRYSKPR
jgi:toxin-antitoxin system PIN domain toxin